MQDVFITFFIQNVGFSCCSFMLLAGGGSSFGVTMWSARPYRKALKPWAASKQASKQASNTKRNEESNTKHTFRLQSLCQLSLAVT